MQPFTKSFRALALFTLGVLFSSPLLGADKPAENPIRVICFGAHPDDCEIQAGGTAALYASKGHKVKFVSLTNGDIGHWRDAGGPLARRRHEEVVAAAKKLGIEVEVVDNHDGELLPTLENRKRVTQLIREWKADVVMSHRPNDYHPDHRYAGMLVQDAAYMVTVPNFCPDIPVLSKNPAFFYFPDRFQKPNPFKPDVVVDVGPVMDKKLDALVGMVSQFAEGGATGNDKLFPGDADQQKKRLDQVRQSFSNRQKGLANEFRAAFVKRLGAEKGEKVTYAEGFELCEYGSQPNALELLRLFPF